MLQTHHVAITNIVNALESSSASRGAQDDDTASTGIATLASLKEFDKISQDFCKTGQKY